LRCHCLFFPRISLLPRSHNAKITPSLLSNSPLELIAFGHVGFDSIFPPGDFLDLAVIIICYFSLLLFFSFGHFFLVNPENCLPLPPTVTLSGVAFLFPQSPLFPPPPRDSHSRLSRERTRGDAFHPLLGTSWHKKGGNTFWSPRSVFAFRPTVFPSCPSAVGLSFFLLLPTVRWL